MHRLPRLQSHYTDMKPTLLCSLGISPFVVIEAFHFLPLGEAGFSSIHVITSSSQSTDDSVQTVREWFACHQPNIPLVISRVAGFSDLRDEKDHVLFEEALFRWFLASAPDPADRFVCLAGGFKTMSSTMQRATSLFGAADLFHVLALMKVETPDDLESALKKEEIRFIPMGAEAGWHQLANAKPQGYPLVREGDLVSVVGDNDLRHRVIDLLEAQQHLYAHFGAIATLPFATLATLDLPVAAPRPRLVEAPCVQ